MDLDHDTERPGVIEIRPAPGVCCPDMAIINNKCVGCGRKYTLLTIPQLENSIRGLNKEIAEVREKIRELEQAILIERMC